MSDRLRDLAHPVAGAVPNITSEREQTHAKAAASPQGGADSRADSARRLVIRGETYGDSGSAFIDWLSISVPQTAPSTGPRLVQTLSELFGGINIYGLKSDRGVFGYDESLNPHRVPGARLKSVHNALPSPD